MKSRILFLIATLAILSSAAAAQANIFTYQGRLNDGGVPANGQYDVRIGIFDANGSTVPVVTEIVIEDVQVIAGVFTLNIPVEPAAFTTLGGAWLEIAVRPGASTGSFVTLTPRQPIGSSPYAIQALNANTAVTSANTQSVGGVPAANIVNTDDPRLSDSRAPLPGSGNYIQNGVNPQAANFNLTGDGTVANLNITNEYRVNGQRFMKTSDSGISIGFDTLLPTEGATSVGFGAGGGLPPGFVPVGSTAATSVGYGAGGGNNGSFFGRLSGRRNTGAGNSFFGTETGLNNTGGQLNSFFGFRAGRATTNSNRNVFFGAHAGQSSTNGELNTLVGADAGSSLVNGSQNTFLGSAAGNEIVTGSFNTFVGTAAGSPNGFENTMLGANAQCQPGASECSGVTLIGSLTRGTNVNSNATAIGYRAQVQQDNSLVLGSINGVNGATSDTNVGIGTTAPSQRLHVVGNTVVTGNLGVGTTSPTNKLQVVGGSLFSGDVTISGNLNAPNFILPGSSGSYIQNTTTTQAASNFSISGSGTANIFNAGSQFQIGGNRVFSVAGVENVFVARNAGLANTTGGFNSFVGFDAGASNTGGNNNAFFGHSAGRSNVSGTGNTFLGSGSGFANTTAGGLTFVGEHAGASNTTGVQNVFVGSAAGFANGNGFANTFIGWNSGANNVSGNSNTFVGKGSGTPNSTGSENTFVGVASGARNTTGQTNSFFGFQAGFSTVTTGGNSFFGHNAGLANTAGTNSFFGASSGLSNTTGSGNSFFGNQSGNASTTGSGNAFFGASSGFANTIGASNTFLGASAAARNTSGSDNSFIGASAGFFNTTGTKNIFIGKDSGRDNTTGSQNTIIGWNATVASANLQNATAIGADSIAYASNQVQLGRGGLDTVSIGLLGTGGTVQVCLNSSLPNGNVLAACSSSIRYKNNVNRYPSGLDLIRKLRPVSFDWKESGIADIGLVAEDVAAIEPLLTTTNAKGEVEGVKYDRIGVALVNAVNEQQSDIERLKADSESKSRQIEQLLQANRRQQAQIEALTKLFCSANPAAAVCR